MKSVRDLNALVVHRPSRTVEGRRTAEADEDEFTLAATAVERLAVFAPSDAPRVPIDLLTIGPVGPEWAWPHWLGRPVSLHPLPPGPRALARAFETASTGGEGPALVVAARRSSDPARDDDGALAFLFGPSGSGLARAEIPVVEESLGLLAAADRFAAEVTGRVSCVTQTDPARPMSGPGRAPTAVDAERLDAVSEGAYVPRPRYIENLASRWRFEGERCGACGTTSFPARGRCRRCGRYDGLTPLALPREGVRVVATTVIGRGGQPTEFDAQVAAHGPYEVVLAELAPEIRVTLQVTEASPGAVRIGDRVDTRLRRLYPMEGEWRYGRKAVPIAGSPPAA